MEVVNIAGVDLHLASPVNLQMKWVGQSEVARQLEASWMILEEDDVPMNPRLVGKPGVGKTTLAYTVANKIGRDVLLLQATMDTRPEDLIISPVIDENQKIKYVASALVSAMIQGGVCILDEGNRMSEKSWASLAPLLDHRRYVESVVAGVTIKAHPDFRFCTTMNEDSSTFEIPEYIFSRIQPGIFIDFPSAKEERAIIKSNVPHCEEELLEYVVSFLQRAHSLDQAHTVRDGINISRYAMKWMKTSGCSARDAFENAVPMILKNTQDDSL